MGKVLLFLSLLSLIIVGVGTAVAPDNPLFWLASSDSAFQHVRVLIGAILAIQLVTRPPRHAWFRVLAGSFAVFTGFWAVQQSYYYHMQLLDSLAFLGAACGVFATALERNVSRLSTAVMVRNKLIL